jgi:SAM-dependent methyltransferase
MVDTSMANQVDLYDSAYGNYELDLYRQIRVETYGEDLGQTSWVTTEESDAIPAWLELRPDGVALEIGCGSGRYALRVAEGVGCSVLGLDINAHGIANANELARGRNLHALVRFEQCDVSEGLPAADESCDAVFANDVLCHLPNRSGVLREIFRVLRPGGRMLFSDALVVGGMVTNEEIATRSSIGRYVFSPPGENERLSRAAGFRLVSTTDTSEDAAAIAKRWHDAREKWREALMAAEGESNFAGLQRFLACVYTLTSGRRLLRQVYLAEREARKDA